MAEDSGFFFPEVEERESGQKLLRFLERRLDLPASLLHRWIRTGQVRLNGKRCKPFQRVSAGDAVRLPPFALAMGRPSGALPRGSQPLPPLAGEANGLLAFVKPAGLPTQPGTGHEDSMCSLLNSHFAASLFKPAPCHRLDKDTSGILLVGATFAALSQAQEWFRRNLVHKEYLAWTRGTWPHARPLILRHYLRKEGQPGKVRMQPAKAGAPWAREALCIAAPVLNKGGNSLLQIRLLTGRTHQIRAQLAAAGFPVLGDGKYGAAGGPMRLHAMRLILPDGHEFSCPPPWDKDFMPPCLPPPLFPGYSASRLPDLRMLPDP